jgi:DsbC/DsbD-like thiol-disulfide interchange protein
MTIDRRAFVAGAALAAITPVSRLAAGMVSPPPASASAVAMDRVVFLIDGWSVPSEEDTADEVWIRIGHGWRTYWR